MNSKYAYVQFIKGISETDETIKGELIQLNYPIYEGEINLMSINEYNKFKEDFPDRIEGGIIKQDNLMNMINYLYDIIKREIEELKEIDNETVSKLKNIKNGFEVNGILKPSNNSNESINDLANKFFWLQEQVRKNQRENKKNNNYIR